MRFADLHRSGDPFVLPNAWDVGSARVLIAAGFPAIGTTSLGVAAAHGFVDGARGLGGLTLELAEDLLAADLECPITCDVVDGFSTDSVEVADFVERLAVHGVNIEDATDGALVTPAAHARKIAAIKDRCPGVFVNARTDVFWLGQGGLQDVLDRLSCYVDAGADGVFVPGPLNAATIEQITGAISAPLTVWASTVYTRDQLAAVGVARISTGSLLYRASLTQALTTARAVRDGLPLLEAMSYEQVQSLHSFGPASHQPTSSPAPGMP